MKLTKIKAGMYTTQGIIIEKDGGFWYAYDKKTGQSVVDCENTLSDIKESLAGYFRKHN